MGAVYAFFVGLATRVLGWFGLSFGAVFSLARLGGFFKKILVGGLMTIGLPLAINTGLYSVAENLSPMVFDSLGLSPQTINIVGVGAWMASEMQLPLCFSIYMGFVAQRGVINMTKMGGALSKFTTNRYS